MAMFLPLVKTNFSEFPGNQSIGTEPHTSSTLQRTPSSARLASAWHPVEGTAGVGPAAQPELREGTRLGSEGPGPGSRLHRASPCALGARSTQRSGTATCSHASGVRPDGLVVWLEAKVVRARLGHHLCYPTSSSAMSSIYRHFSPLAMCCAGLKASRCTVYPPPSCPGWRLWAGAHPCTKRLWVPSTVGVRGRQLIDFSLSLPPFL